MHYIRDECGDEALTLCRPMGLGFPAVRTRQEGKEKKICEAVRRTIWQLDCLHARYEQEKQVIIIREQA